jgi:hypothetical protein
LHLLVVVPSGDNDDLPLFDRVYTPMFFCSASRPVPGKLTSECLRFAFKGRPKVLVEEHIDPLHHGLVVLDPPATIYAGSVEAAWSRRLGWRVKNFAMKDIR